MFEAPHHHLYSLGGTVILNIPFGPHILPSIYIKNSKDVSSKNNLSLSVATSQSHPLMGAPGLDKTVRIYKPNLDRNLIGKENKNTTIIYQWINLINGKRYVGSAWNGSSRLLSY